MTAIAIFVLQPILLIFYPLVVILLIQSDVRIPKFSLATVAYSLIGLFAGTIEIVLDVEDRRDDSVLFMKYGAYMARIIVGVWVLDGMVNVSIQQVTQPIKGLCRFDPYPFNMTPRKVTMTLVITTLLLLGMAIVAMLFYWKHDALYAHVFAGISVANLTIVLAKVLFTSHYLRTVGTELSEKKALLTPLIVLTIVMIMHIMQVFVEGTTYLITEYVVEFTIVFGLFALMWQANGITAWWKRTKGVAVHSEGILTKRPSCYFPTVKPPGETAA